MTNENNEGFDKGISIFKQYGTDGYKNCKTGEEFSGFSFEERITKCGYSEQHWNKSGGCNSTAFGTHFNSQPKCVKVLPTDAEVLEDEQ
jgi:hypothetical protein